MIKAQRVVKAHCLIKLKKTEPTTRKKSIINTVCSDSGVFSKIQYTPSYKEIIWLELESICGSSTNNPKTKVLEVLRLVLVLNFVEDIYKVSTAEYSQNLIQGNKIEFVKEFGIDTRDSWYPKHSLSDHDDGITISPKPYSFKSTNPELEKAFEGMFMEESSNSKSQLSNGLKKSRSQSNLSISELSKTFNAEKSKSLITPLKDEPLDVHIDPEDSASNIQKERPRLCFGAGSLKFGKFELEKMKPHYWSTEAMKALHSRDCPLEIMKPMNDWNEELVTGFDLSLICNYLISMDLNSSSSYSILNDIKNLAKHVNCAFCQGFSIQYIYSIIMWLLLNVLTRKL